MVHIEQLPFIIQLLEDDSPLVQEAIRTELKAYGNTLEASLEQINWTPSPSQRALLNRTLIEQRQADILNAWPTWSTLDNQYTQLERAFNLLSNYMNPSHEPGELTHQLNKLAREFTQTNDHCDPQSLANFLFNTQNFKGCQTNYYTPDKSNLLNTILTRTGNPISLTCIFMLVGKRLNLEIHGCSFPGHFLAIVKKDNEKILVDCFNKGRFIAPSTFRENNDHEVIQDLESLITQIASPKAIIRRVLNNMLNAYTLEGKKEDVNLIKKLGAIQQESAFFINKKA